MLFSSVFLLLCLSWESSRRADSCQKKKKRERNNESIVHLMVTSGEGNTEKKLAWDLIPFQGQSRADSALGPGPRHPMSLPTKLGIMGRLKA